MRKYLNVCLAGFLVYALAISCKPKSGDKSSVVLKTKLDSVSYIIGTEIGSNFKQNNLELNSDLIKEGIDETMKGNKPMISEDVIKKVMNSFQKDMMAKQGVKQKADFSKNKADGEKFLAENKNKPGVVTTASGLQYKIIKAGNGPIPKATDKVKVNYEGKLIDGKVFDSSYERNQPASFNVNGVIKGWGEAVQLMSVGSTWELYIPENLAYGENSPKSIPPGSVLIFKVELLSIEKPDNDEKSAASKPALKMKTHK